MAADDPPPVNRVGAFSLRALRASDISVLVRLLPDDFDHDPTVPRRSGSSLDEHRAEWFASWLESMLAGGARAEWVPFVALLDAEVVGLQVIKWNPRTRVADSTSWLAPRARGRGLGVRMRRLALAHAFEVLGAERAVTSARAGNAASIAVSRRVGYREVGTTCAEVAGSPRPLVVFEMTRAEWARAHP